MVTLGIVGNYFRLAGSVIIERRLTVELSLLPRPPLPTAVYLSPSAARLSEAAPGSWLCLLSLSHPTVTARSSDPTTMKSKSVTG